MESEGIAKQLKGEWMLSSDLVVKRIECIVWSEMVWDAKWYGVGMRDGVG